MQVIVENKVYHVTAVRQEAVGYRIAGYRMDGYRMDVVGYAVKLETVEQPILDELTPQIQDVDGFEEGTFCEWLRKAKVYTGENCLICCDAYAGLAS